MPFDLLVLSQLAAADEDGRFPTNPMIRVSKKAHKLRKILVSFLICLNRLDSLFFRASGLAWKALVNKMSCTGVCHSD